MIKVLALEPNFGSWASPPCSESLTTTTAAESLTTHDVYVFYLCRDRAPHVDATLWPTPATVDAMINLRLWTLWPIPAACGGFRDRSPPMDIVADPAARTWWIL
jgi:hypothetical protein